MRWSGRLGSVTGLGVALVWAAGAGAQTVRYVKSDAAGAETGTSWQDAFRDLQAALAAAQPGDQVWVAAGTYRPTGAGGDRDVSFALRPGVALLGGFAGTETTPGQRDWNAHATILSGDLNADDADGFVNSAENSYHVLVAYSVEADAVLDGFIVRCGRADGPGFGAVPASQEQGSGLNVYDASPLIRNCVFERNWSWNHGALNDHGHATTVTDCEFRDNYSAAFGAGLYIHFHTATTVLRCTFRNNETVGAEGGGGLYSRSVEGCSVRFCTFEGNRANFGAGMYNADGSAVSVTDCVFRDNTSALGGGGLYALNATPAVSRCTFQGNVAGLGVEGGAGGGGGSGGGGIWTEGGHALIDHCTFTNNRASFGGGCYNIHQSLAEVSDCQFTTNQAAEAGGLYTLNSPVIVSRCRFTGNRAAEGAFSVGGGLSNYFSDSVVRDSVFEANTAELGGGGMYSEGEHPEISNCTFTANTTFGATEAWGGGMLMGYFTHAQITGCVLSLNSARRAGGIYCMAFAEPNIVNCTIVANRADEPGGGIVSSFSTVSRVANCLLRANLPDQLAGDFAAVRYAHIQGGYTGPGADHVRTGDPGLVRLPSPGADGEWGTPDDDAGDLRPSRGAACIDAGDSGEVPPGVTTDVAGNPRRVDDAGVPDSGAGAPPVVDAGAYEFQGRSCLADFNGDALLNSQDFFDFLAAFFKDHADFNRDGVTNSQDFFDFLTMFFAGC